MPCQTLSVTDNVYAVFAVAVYAVGGEIKLTLLETPQRSRRARRNASQKVFQLVRRGYIILYCIILYYTRARKSLRTRRLFYIVVKFSTKFPMPSPLPVPFYYFVLYPATSPTAIEIVPVTSRR